MQDRSGCDRLKQAHARPTQNHHREPVLCAWDKQGQGTDVHTGEHGSLAGPTQQARVETGESGWPKTPGCLTGWLRPAPPGGRVTGLESEAAQPLPAPPCLLQVAEAPATF